MKTPHFLQIGADRPFDHRRELLNGLLADSACISPKYFYDALGARLFAAITELPEYYPTRTEAAIFAQHSAAMAKEIASSGGAATLVDLGAGNCEKAARLFATFAVQRYVAVDISVDYLTQSLRTLQREHPAMDLIGIGMDFSSELALPATLGEQSRLIFYPGSSISNFDPAEALTFLRQMRAAAQGGGLLIGVDLVKPVEILEAAYDDPLGVTAAFNRNVLLNINAQIGSDFQLADWRHVAFFNAPASRVEMHLKAARNVHVKWPDGERYFASGERIHTENSYKWQVEDFYELIASAGFVGNRYWTDERGWFAIFHANAS